MRDQSSRIWLVSGLIVTALVALTASRAPEAQQAAHQPRVVEVPIQGRTYGAPITIEVGDSVVWVNNDETPHTATRDPEDDKYIDQVFDTGFIQKDKKSDPIVFLKESGPGGLEYVCDIHDSMKGKIVVKARPSGPPALPSPSTVHHQPPTETQKDLVPSLHSFVVTGSSGSQFFLHHYGLFNNPNHEFHVTLEGRLDNPTERKKYDDYRKKLKGKFKQQLVIVDMNDDFLLREIKTKARTTLPAKFVHTGPYEDIYRKGTIPKKSEQRQWGVSIPGLEKATITITDIIQFRQFDPKDKYPEALVYQLYGNEKEVFMTHEITQAPSFEHIVQLEKIPAFLTPELIKKNPLVAIPSKRLSSGGQRTVDTAVLNDNSHFLTAPPNGTINASEPFQRGEVVTVLIQGDPKPNERKQFTIGKSIFFDFRILNR